jgi:hypothetical protein
MMFNWFKSSSFLWISYNTKEGLNLSLITFLFQGNILTQWIQLLVFNTWIKQDKNSACLLRNTQEIGTIKLGKNEDTSFWRLLSAWETVLGQMRVSSRVALLLSPNLGAEAEQPKHTALLVSLGLIIQTPPTSPTHPPQIQTHRKEGLKFKVSNWAPGVRMTSGQFIFQCSSDTRSFSFFKKTRSYLALAILELTL